MQLHVNTDFSVTGWMLCVIPHILKYAKESSDIDHRKQINNVIKHCFMGYLKTKYILLNTYFGLSTPCFIIRMVHSMVMDLSGKENT